MKCGALQSVTACSIAIAVALFAGVVPLSAQDASVFGIVRQPNGAAVVGASVIVEGTPRMAFSDTTGRYVLTRVPPGAQVLVVERIGFARARVSITVPVRGLLNRDVVLSERALELPTLTVTADATARARGELGTASVINQEAIRVQTASSLAGVLELVPGVQLQPPGLGGIQQFALRAAPASTVAGLTAGGPSAADLSSLGTLIILDGVPLSNNANLQSTGPRGEARLTSTAGGGIDLRRIPASTLERVEVIRGVPSARYGDLTQGAIVVETRAGAFTPEARGLFDPFTAGGTLTGGWRAGDGHAVSSNLDVTRTRIAPGWRLDQATRIAGQAAYRASFGRVIDASAGEMALERPRLLLDARFDAYRLFEESPEDSAALPGRASFNRDAGFRASQRLRLHTSRGGRFEFTGSLEYQRQRSMVQNILSRRAMPFTDLLIPGRTTGRFIAGEYLSQLTLDGDVWNGYARVEGEHPLSFLGLSHRLLTGGEFRRESNTGPGYQFDIERPPQVTFNGVQGFDRPRAFDALPALATTAFYVDDRVLHVLPGDVTLDVQAGLRADMLHDGGHWASSIRDAVIQPRFNVQIAPRPWLRLRGGVGRTAKLPTLGQLFPAPQYFDVVNVNWYTADAVERLAVLTTFVEDPTNPDLGLSTGLKREAGFELATNDGQASLSVVAFNDRTDGGVGFQPRTSYLLRDQYALRDSIIGDGQPTEFVDPPIGADTVPIVLDVPANNLTLESRGWEIVARLPEFRPLRMRLEVQAALLETTMFSDGVDFGLRFAEFQMDETTPRAPYWDGVTLTGKRGLATYRLVHHRPELGLVIMGTVQHIFTEERRSIAGTDTLAFAGYITRTGELVPVPREQRGLPENRDLRQSRNNTLVAPFLIPADWLLSVQASLDLPLDGRLSFYAFNALDRKGIVASPGREARNQPGMRFGLEVSLAPTAAAQALGQILSSAH